MPANYAVCADVVDIGSDIPQPTDEFLVDTNVWAFLVYSKMTIGPHPPNQRQVAAYSNYVRQTMSCGSRLRRCCLTFAELAHLIEKTERDIYLATNSFLNPKEFRHNLTQERAGVVAEIQSAWLQVKAMASPADALVNDTMTDASLVKIQTQALDGYDLFILEAAASAGIANIITDDGDYCCVSGIKVFTSNPRVLLEAHNNGRLIVR